MPQKPYNNNMNVFTKYKMIIFSLDNLLLILGALTMSLAPLAFGGMLEFAIALLLQVVGMLVLILVFIIKFRFAPPERGKIMPFIILYGFGFVIIGLLLGHYFAYLHAWLLILTLVSYAVCSVILAGLRVSFFGK